MGTYNILKAEIECPRCRQKNESQIELFFGYTNEMLEYQLGDEYIWRDGKAVRNGGRPENGNIDGEGYTECEICGKDFFVKVIVRDAIIQKVEIDIAKKGYKA